MKFSELKYPCRIKFITNLNKLYDDTYLNETDLLAVLDYVRRKGHKIKEIKYVRETKQ